MIGLGFEIPKIAANAEEDVELGYELFIAVEEDTSITADDEMFTVLA
jgi:hypothetical protein